MQPADKIVCCVFGLYSPKNLNPVKEAFLQPVDIHSHIFLSLCFFSLFSRDSGGQAKHKVCFGCQPEKWTVNTCMPLIYSHREWKCQKTIQLIFGSGQEDCVEDRINTHTHTHSEKERERGDRLGDVNTAVKQNVPWKPPCHRPHKQTGW